MSERDSKQDKSQKLISDGKELAVDAAELAKETIKDVYENREEIISSTKNTAKQLYENRAKIIDDTKSLIRRDHISGMFKKVKPWHGIVATAFVIAVYFAIGDPNDAEVNAAAFSNGVSTPVISKPEDWLSGEELAELQPIEQGSYCGAFMGRLSALVEEPLASQLKEMAMRFMLISGLAASQSDATTNAASDMLTKAAVRGMEDVNSMSKNANSDGLQSTIGECASVYKRISS